MSGVDTLRKRSGPRAARPPVHAGLPTCADVVLTGG
jgi:hypothetical protein